VTLAGRGSGTSEGTTPSSDDDDEAFRSAVLGELTAATFEGSKGESRVPVCVSGKTVPGRPAPLCRPRRTVQPILRQRCKSGAIPSLVSLINSSTSESPPPPAVRATDSLAFLLVPFCCFTEKVTESGLMVSHSAGVSTFQADPCPSGALI